MTDTTAPDAITQAANPWQEAVVDALCCAHVYHAGHDSDPKGALNDLLIWERQVSLDPAVSQGARNLLAAHGAGEGLREAWVGNTPAEQGVYDHYMTGSTRGDLYTYVRSGKLGVNKPSRSHGHAFAAWMAGQHLALLTPPTDAGSTTREGGEGVAAGMKPWAGGPKPADWDGRAVQFRDGKVRYAPHGAVWKLGWDHSYGDGDIIAYSTKAALATISSPDASPDSGDIRARLQAKICAGQCFEDSEDGDVNFCGECHWCLHTLAERALAASPASLSGGAEVTSFLAALTDGSLVREILAAGAIIDVMTGGQFDWRSRINDDDFTSSADWMTALEYARAVLHPSPEAPANRQEAGEVLAWLADCDNLILFNGVKADGWWEVRRGSTKGEVRGRGATPLDALRAALSASNAAQVSK